MAEKPVTLREAYDQGYEATAEYFIGTLSDYLRRIEALDLQLSEQALKIENLELMLSVRNG